MRIIHLFKLAVKTLFGSEKNYGKGMNSNIDALSDLVIIGEGFVSAPGSIVLAHDASTIIHCGKTRVEKTVIGKNVFLGANAVVLPGVTIGDNAIIGAAAVVTKDIPSDVVAIGNPAKVVTTVKEYIEKCETRNVLYPITEPVLKKHGTGVKATKEETQELLDSIYSLYNERNKQSK